MPLQAQLKKVFDLSEEVLTGCLTVVQMCTTETLDGRILLLLMIIAVK